MNDKSLARRLWREEEGGEAVEYGLIIAIIAVGLIVVLYTFGGKIADLFGTAGDEIADPQP